MTPEAVPYAPSWIDRTMAWIETLPLPVWVGYILLYLLATLYVQVGVWLSGSPSFNADIRYPLANAVWMAVPIAALHYLSAEGKRALAAFRRAMNADDETVRRLEYRLTRIPKWPVLGINAALALILILLTSRDPALVAPEPLSPITMLMLLAYSSLGFSFVPIFVYQTLRQLRVVAEMYAMVEHVNVFNLQPLYVLSGLTAKTAAAWILLANLTLVLNVVFNFGMQGMELSFTIPLLLAQVFFALLAFIVPLWGVHRRIEQDKDRVLEQNSRRLESAYRELERRMAEGDLADMDAFHKGAMALMAFRKEIESISTWPWQPATFRGFLSAVLLPIFLFVVQQALVRYIR
jgi:hypothetical protein